MSGYQSSLLGHFLVSVCHRTVSTSAQIGARVRERSDCLGQVSHTMSPNRYGFRVSLSYISRKHSSIRIEAHHRRCSCDAFTQVTVPCVRQVGGFRIKVTLTQSVTVQRHNQRSLTSSVYSKVAILTSTCIAIWEGMFDEVSFAAGNQGAFRRVPLERSSVRVTQMPHSFYCRKGNGSMASLSSRT